MRQAVWAVLIGLLGATSSQGGEVEFVEDFALAQDRPVALKQLIPGTEDYYYWSCLHLLNTQQFAEVDESLKLWVGRHGETNRVWEIRTRLALSSYDLHPQKTLEYLRSRFGIQYPHQKEELNAEPNLPSELNPELISRASLQQRALQTHQNSLNGFEDAALEWLVAETLSPELRRELLARLTRPDHPRLVQLVADDLEYRQSGGFGSHAIHGQLLLAQLEELLTLRPDLLNQQNFVRAYLTKLQPSPDVDWQHDLGELAALLDRMQGFADRLGPVHNTLKAHLLYHRLVLDRRQGQYDKARFMAYLGLPRPCGYISKTLRESEAFQRFACDLSSNYDAATLLPPIGDDEAVVRSYLSHFFLAAADTKDFEPYVNDVYLRHLFAETKILHGLGDPEQWASLLPPELFRQLKERVDIEFAYSNKSLYRVDEPVQLELRIKNVSTLIVKVFEINTRNYYRQTGQEVNTDLNLDGLVANVEQVHRYDDSPLQQISRKFEFPMLDKPGVYVVDFIGNGQSSRALIRKGYLRHLVQTTPAGHSFTILNEQNGQVRDATIWLAGHEYTADEDGRITVPFSTQPGQAAIVLTAPVAGVDGATYSSLGFFQHEGENYQLQAGFHVDRESLLNGKTAQLLVRPGLSVNGTPVSVKLLQHVKLTIIATDLEGTASSVEIPDFPCFEDRESVHEFQVPPRLVHLQFQLTAKVTPCTTGSEVNVAAEGSFALNSIDRTEKIEDLHLLQAEGQYLLELRGKTGEAKVSRPVIVNLKHRDFRDGVDAVLKTDPQGRVALGDLENIDTITARGPEGTSHSWTLPRDRHTYRQSVHGRVGETITLPYMGGGTEPSRDELSLLELRGGTFGIDRFEHLRIRDALVLLENLPAGDFDLLLKSTGTRVTVRVAQAEQVGSFAVGSLRQLETSRLAPVQIDAITPADETLRIQLRNVSPFTRVHVFVSRYLPAYNAHERLSGVGGVEPYLFRYAPAESVYLTGRNIGDEYRYIIDRKYAPQYAGNMLERPSLLLNPWAVRDTETGQQMAAGGGQFGQAGNRPEAAAERAAAPESEALERAEELTANLDFLADVSAAFVNLVPDDQGVIEVPLQELGAHSFVRVTAVDPLHTTTRDMTLADAAIELRDQRLLQNLDIEQHFTQQKRITVVPPNQLFTLQDITTARFEVYDSLPRVYQLYATLSKNAQLAEFSFLLNWPALEPGAKQELYSKHASHELNFFLSRKDPEFFGSVIRPFLAHKMHKTFMDRYLLEEDLAEYALPWNYAQLNVVERILLARRLEGERQRTARHVGDLYALLPPNPEQFILLFDTAVQRSALETSDPWGKKDAIREALLEVELQRDAAPVTATLEDAPAESADKSLDDGLAAGVAGALGRKSMAEDRARGAVARLRARDGSAERHLGEFAKLAEEDPAAAAPVADMDLFFDAETKRRQAVRQLFRQLEKTQEWAENNYYHLPIDQQTAALITVNAFWNDYAQHHTDAPFLSRNLAEASRSFPEILLALAVLDLPFESPPHESQFENRQMKLQSTGPLVVFHEEILPAVAPEGSGLLLVSQNYFKHGDRHRTENGEQVDKFVSDEFLIHTVYGCQIVITNPTSSRQKLNVLTQIPRGAMAVLGGRPTATLHLDLEPYHTQTVEYHFYFPAPGQFPHFPVHVARNENLVAVGEPTTMNVVEHPTKVDSASWDYVSQHGSLDEVIAFLEQHNIDELNLERIAWRMQDQAAFERVLDLLQRRHVYHHTLWSYALKHNVVPAARQYLQHADQIVTECGGTLQSSLLVIDPVSRRTYEHLEYKPLVNARAHALGKRRQIVNERLHWQYHRFLKELAYQRELTDDQLLAVTYYLLLQDRVEEALGTFTRVHRDKIATQMQYDYCDAYLAFFTDDPERARAIAQQYVEHPVLRWRNVFATVIAQLNEAAGNTSELIDAENRDQQQAQLAATEPDFSFTVEAGKIRIHHQNLEAVKVNFYEVDVELLFSRNPFVKSFGDNFASIRPNLTLDVPLSPDQPSTVIDLPEKFRNSNVLVEVTAAGSARTEPYFSNSLAVQVIENYGQVKVTHRETLKPISKAYVKVYAQTASGEVKFYKDGYTDLRGRFDYASLSTPDLDAAAKFSILVLSDEYGAVVQEASPPKR